MRGLLLAMMVSGCLQVQSTQVECGDNKICPADYTCTSFGCASAEQVEACTGVAPGESCTTSVGNGACTDGACWIAVCGNDVEEAFEVCDDGNTVNGDGCNGTCTSDESCGNGVAELAEACDCGDAEHPGGSRCIDENSMLTVNGGALCSTSCTQRRCGDGVVDPDELCDDGNNIGGDACSFDCQSLETCGNGVLDYFAGERCDDGNKLDRDGCSATCAEELPLWREVPRSLAPGGRNGAALVFDPARRRWVMFGGARSIGNVISTDETWEFTGTNWEQRTFATTPPARKGAAIAYDAKRKRIVMFGGVALRSISQNSGPYGDTWEYDGVAWRRLQPPSAPSARMYASMAYDGARGRVVLFGGLAGTFLDDAWEFDGNTWTQIAVTGTKPAGRDRAALAYDPVGNRLVLYGGVSQGDVMRSDTWTLSGATWTNLPTSVGVRLEHSLAYDPVAGRVVLYGGTSGSTYHGDVYELAGSSWSPRATNTAPAGRAGAAVAADPVTGRLLVAFGYNTGGVLSDVNALAAGTWSSAAPTGAPPAISDHGMVYDTMRGRTVFIGPSNGVLVTWAFDGLTWRNLAPSNSPAVRDSIHVAYDVERDRIVLFGGAGPYTNDTWEFDGTNWQPKTPTTSPSPRGGHALAYDPVRRRVVLFGGTYPGLPEYDETWAYDGTTWQKLTPSTVPPARARHGMVYDASRNGIVMFGGLVANVDNDETWEFDGTNWSQRTLLESPPPRSFYALAYDASQRKVVLFGGNHNVLGTLGDTWILDDKAWRKLPVVLTAPPPSRRAVAAMAFDSARNQIVLYGGYGTDFLDDTWLLAIPPTVTAEACTSGLDYDRDAQAGCADNECWGACSPLCPPTLASCPMIGPRCGDAMCNGAETCRNCAADCAIGTGACLTRCGDAYCDASETLAACPGDCTP